MLPIRKVLTIAALAIPLTLSACDRSTAPSPVVAEYALAAISSVALPTEPFPGAGITILSDTVRLREDGTGVRSVRYMVGDTRALRGGSSSLTWRAIDDSLEVSLVCDDTVLALCIAPPHLAGQLRPGQLWVIDRAVIYGGSAAVYNRVGMR
jgi:hypothetical protein